MLNVLLHQLVIFMLSWMITSKLLLLHVTIAISCFLVDPLFLWMKLLVHRNWFARTAVTWLACGVLHNCRVNVWLFTDDSRATGVNFNKLGPDFLLYSLIVELDNQLLSNLWHRLRLTLWGVHSTIDSLVQSDTILLEKFEVCDGAWRQNSNAIVRTLVNFLQNVLIDCLGDLIGHETFPFE